MPNLDTDEGLRELLQEVRQSINGALKAESDVLAKAAPGESTEGEKEPTDESSSESASSPADKSPPAVDASPEAPPAASPPVASATPPADDSAPADPSADPDATGDPAADMDSDPAALAAEYAKLPPEMLKLHYLACKQAMFAAMGGPPAAPADASMVAASPPVAPPASPPPAAMVPPPASPAPDAPPALKSEQDLAIATLKAELDGTKQKLNKAEDAMGRVLGYFEKIAATPVRLATTSIADLAKTEKKPVSELSTKEINEQLARIIEKPLSKSDRELINDFYKKTVGVEKLTHLFV